MKKAICLLLMMGLLGLTGCQPDTPDDEVDVPPVSSDTLRLDTLSVELSRGSLSTDVLSTAVKELPTLFETYFAEIEDVDVGQVHVTVGSSAAVTAETLMAGNIDFAFLPLEDYLRYGDGAVVLLADTYETSTEAGVRALICAAPTEYGAQLDELARSGKPLSWEEVNHARWGVLNPTTLGSYHCFDSWLADNYEGTSVSSLSTVTRYDSAEELFRAAAAGEIDALSIYDDARQNIEIAWLLEENQVDETGVGGFGRTEDIYVELPVLDVTEKRYTTVVAATPAREELNDPRFQAAIDTVLKRLVAEKPELASALGASAFALVTDEELDAMR